MRPSSRQTYRFPTSLALSAGIALIAFGFSEANAETRSFPLSNFESVDASAGVRVILKQGAFGVSAEESTGQFDQLKLEVVNGKLFVGRKPNMGRGPNYTVTVTAPTYSGVAVSSGAHLSADALSVKTLEAAVSSGAHASLKGSCTALTVNTSSGSHFDGEALKCEAVTAAASSGSNAETFASRSVTASASSGAHVTFGGQPANVTRSANSGGSISAR